jgi:hypothetical protein
MKTGALICLLLLTFSASPAFQETPGFEKARRLGEGKQRSFFLFSTSSGKYIIRHDGMGQISANKTHLTFHLIVGTSRRVEQVYFQEYEGDLLLSYEVNDGRGYLTRLNPQTRKKRWTTPIDLNNIGSCKVEAGEAHCGELNEITKVNLRTGAEIKTI